MMFIPLVLKEPATQVTGGPVKVDDRRTFSHLEAPRVGCAGEQGWEANSSLEGRATASPGLHWKSPKGGLV